MKTIPSKSEERGFTLVEVAVVVAILAVLMAMLLPAMYKPNSGRRSTVVACMSNQKQVSLGYFIWAGDNENHLPMQVSTNGGGTMEFVPDGPAAQHFQPLTNYVRSPAAFICPSDEVKTGFTNHTAFTDKHLSYFINVDLDLSNRKVNPTERPMTGDRHLRVGTKPVKPGLLIFSPDTGADFGWTKELHKASKQSGCIGFADGHIELIKSTAMRDVVKKQAAETNRFVVP